MIIHYGMTVSRMEMLAVSVRKMKALTEDGQSTDDEDGESDSDW